MNKKELKHAIFGDNALISLLKKVLEYGLLFTGFWALGLPAFEKEVDKRIEAHDTIKTEEESKKTPFRVLLGEEMGIPSDRVHIAIGQIKHDVDAALDSVQHFSNYWIPYLRSEKSRIRPRLIILDNGDEYWVADDNKDYRVERNDEDYGFYYKDGEWIPIYK